MCLNAYYKHNSHVEHFLSLTVCGTRGKWERNDAFSNKTITTLKSRQIGFAWFALVQEIPFAGRIRRALKKVWFRPPQSPHWIGLLSIYLRSWYTSITAITHCPIFFFFWFLECPTLKKRQPFHWYTFRTNGPTYESWGKIIKNMSCKGQSWVYSGVAYIPFQSME